MKDELNCSHNGGQVAYLLQSVAIHFNLTVYTKRFFAKRFYIHKKKEKIIFT